MNYWFDSFSEESLNAFRNYGERLCCFRKTMRNVVERVQPKDILLCYCLKEKHGRGQRWIGAVEVIGPSSDRSRIHKEDYPVRLDVRPLISLDLECGVPMQELEGKVDFYKSPADKGTYKGLVRRSLNFIKPSDGQLIHRLLEEASNDPVAKAVDPKKLAMTPDCNDGLMNGKNSVPLFVSVPNSDDLLNASECASTEVVVAGTAGTRHTEVQYALLKLGKDMGFKLWVARNDRSKTWKNHVLGDISGLLDALPTQFNEATNRKIELIDVLWLKGNSIRAAFEIECTTSVYSGLLRMSDLLASHPNLNIKFYLVAPDERRQKVAQEIQRRTFTQLEKPLRLACGFLSFSKLMEKIEGIERHGLAQSLRPDFLDTIAEHFDAEAEGD